MPCTRLGVGSPSFILITSSVVQSGQYVRSVGQDVSPGKCIFLSTSKTVRPAMKLWDIAGDGNVLEIPVR